MSIIRDEFLGVEDLDLRNLSEEELLAYWDLWLEQAQATNDLDCDTYSHGVFTSVPACGPKSITHGRMQSMTGERKEIIR